MKSPKRVAIDVPPHHIWEAPDMEWLEHHHLILGKSARKIAAEVGCSDWKAQQWIRDAGWREPKRVSNDPDAPLRMGEGASAGAARFVGVKRSWLVRQYVELDKSAKQIADEIGTTHHTVWQWLLKHNVPTRTREEMNQRHSKRMSGKGNPAWQGGSDRKYQRRKLIRSGRERRCEWCGARKRLQVHHRNADVEDGDLANLAWLCRHCNMLEAHIRGLVEAGRATTEWRGNELIIKFGGR